jgi:hypothetical protein
LPAGLVAEPDVYYGRTDRDALVDVNAATVEQLVALPGMSRRAAQRAVREREARGGFRTVAEFAEVASLRPHEHARLRTLVTCTPRRDPETGTPPGTIGRVVDV